MVISTKKRGLEKDFDTMDTKKSSPVFKFNKIYPYEDTYVSSATISEISEYSIDMKLKLGIFRIESFNAHP